MLRSSRRGSLADGVGIGIGVVLVVATSSCHRADTTGPTFEQARADDQSPFALDKVTFEEKGQQIRLLALEACARSAMHDDARRLAWRKLGNFVQEAWCSGSGTQGEADCSIAQSSQTTRDRHVIEVSTLHYGDGSPYFGVFLNAVWAPKASGWSASLSFAEGGKTIEADGFALSFSRYTEAAGAAADTLVLGDQYGYAVFDEPLPAEESSGDADGDADAGDSSKAATFGRYLTSADSLHATGAALLSRARARVESLLTSHRAKVRVYGQSPERGIPGSSTLRDATAAEEASERAKAKIYFDGKDALLASHYQDMYTSLLLAFPVDRCWK